MLTVSDEVKAKLNSDFCQKEFYLTVGSSNIGNAGIYGDSVKIAKQIMDNTAEFIGCMSSSLEIKVSTQYLAKNDYSGASVSLRMKVYLDDGSLSDYIPLFVGYVDTCNKTADGKWQELTCYDILAYYGDKLVYNIYKSAFRELGSTVTVRDFRTYIIVEGLGLDQESATLPNDDVKIKKRYRKKNMTVLELLKHICQANGVYGYITETGSFGYKTISSASTVTEIPCYRELSYSHSVLNLMKKGAVFRTNSDDAGVYVDWDNYESYVTTDWDDDTSDTYIIDEGDEDVTQSAYIMQGNLIAYKLSKAKKRVMLANIMRSIGNNVTFRSYKAKCNGLPYLQCGDRIQFVNGAGDTIGPFVITKRTLEGTQIMTDTYECEPVEDYDVEDDVTTGTTVSNDGNYISDISGTSNMSPETAEATEVANALSEQEVMVVVSWDEETGVLNTTSKMVGVNGEDTEVTA